MGWHYNRAFALRDILGNQCYFYFSCIEYIVIGFDTIFFFLLGSGKSNNFVDRVWCFSIAKWIFFSFWGKLFNSSEFMRILCVTHEIYLNCVGEWCWWWLGYAGSSIPEIFQMRFLNWKIPCIWDCMNEMCKYMKWINKRKEKLTLDLLDSSLPFNFLKLYITFYLLYLALFSIETLGIYFLSTLLNLWS